MLDGTLDALRTAALSAGDGGGYFPALYARVTRRVIDEGTAGAFADADRMASFVTGFAARYLDVGRDRGAAPGCWRAAFDVAGDGDLLIVQQLLLAINAHVNFDLPQVVVAVADRTGDLPSIRPDFEAVNAVLRATYDDVLEDLDRMTRWTGRVAAMGGGHLFNFSLRGARDQGLAGRGEPLPVATRRPPGADRAARPPGERAGVSDHPADQTVPLVRRRSPTPGEPRSRRCHQGAPRSACLTQAVGLGRSRRSDLRAATTAPAEPPPTTTTSKRSTVPPGAQPTTARKLLRPRILLAGPTG